MKNLQKLNLFSLIILLFFFSCNAKKKRVERNQKNETKAGHFQLYSEPLLHKQELESFEKRIVVIASSDISGKIDIQFESIRGSKGKEDKAIIEVGGFQTWKDYFEIIKSTYPGETFVIDAGNYLLKPQDAAPMFKFF